MGDAGPLAEASRAAPGRAPRQARAYEPALDGLRAACLLGVLLFHAGFDFMSGGFLGVSTFFTLSGLLVTELLLRDVDDLGRVDLAAFWRRRIRRLAPASLAVIAVLALAAPPFTVPAQRARLATDLLSALLQVSNWRFLSGDYAYTLLFSQPSWVQHFWSLSIEAQFYAVFPLVVWIACRRPRARGPLVVLAVGWIAASLAMMTWMGGDPESWDRIYYGTGLRLPELLMGTLLAIGLRVQVGTRPIAAHAAWPRLGLIAMGVAIAAWSLVDLETAWLYRGGFVGYALVSAVWIAGCLAGRGPLHHWLSLAPLVWVGRVSYGAYLVHWPIYVALDAGWPELSPLLRFAVCAPLTLAIAGLSYATLEEPIRRGRGVLGRNPARAFGLALIIWIVAIVVPTSPAQIAAELRASTPIPADGSPVTRARVALFGDSSALSLAWGLDAWIRESAPELALASGVVELGCGVLGPAWIDELDRRGEDSAPWISPRGPYAGVRARCLDQRADAVDYLERHRPRIALVLFGEWDVVGVRDPTTGGFRQLGDPELDDALRDGVHRYIDAFRSKQARVVWLTTPPMPKPRRFPHDEANWEGARLRLNELLREVADARPEDVVLLDLDRLVARIESTEDAEPVRHDGVHFTEQGGFLVAEAGLGAVLIETAADPPPAESND